MTIWEEQQVEERIVEILSSVPTAGAPHAFGRPYVTAYQLAIELDDRYPEVARRLGRQIGGAGIGERNSLAQYLAQQLSRRIGQNPEAFPVEGAFLSNVGVSRFSFVARDGAEITSSLTGSGFDLSLFRLRPTSRG
jgi:hypothetical protein